MSSLLCVRPVFNVGDDPGVGTKVFLFSAKVSAKFTTFRCREITVRKIRNFREKFEVKSRYQLKNNQLKSFSSNLPTTSL
jgi:hypothetical protein